MKNLIIVITLVFGLVSMKLWVYTVEGWPELGHPPHPHPELNFMDHIIPEYDFPEHDFPEHKLPENREL